MHVQRLGRTILAVLAAGLSVGLFQAVAAAGTIDPAGKFAWSTTTGWLNFNPVHGGVTVCSDHLEGFAWAENFGWIKLGTASGCSPHTYSNTSVADYGVNRSETGALSGAAWSTSAGWISFKPAQGGVTINPATGSFDGYAWGENIGWIHLKSTGSVPYNVLLHLSKLFLPLAQK